MRLIYLSSLTFFLVFSSSAQNGKSSRKVDIHGFGKEFKLEEFLTPLDMQGEIWQVHAMASDGAYFFVLYDKETPAIKTYRLRDGKYMGGVGSKGGGPGEFMAFNRSGFGLRKDQMIVQGRKYVRIYNLRVTDDKLEFLLEREVKFPGELGILNRGFLLNKSQFAASVMFSPKEFITIRFDEGSKEKNDKVGDFGDYPNLYPDIPSTAYHHLYQGNTAYSQDGKFLVKAYSKLPLIRIFDLTDESIMDVELIPENEQLSKLIPDKRGKSIANGLDMLGYQGRVKISNDYIVSDYQEVIYERTAMTAQGNVKRIPKTDRFLLLFSRQGKLLAKLLPPDWLSGGFTLTPDNKMIIFHPEIENQLFVVDLSQFR